MATTTTTETRDLPKQIACWHIERLIEAGIRCIYQTPANTVIGKRGTAYWSNHPWLTELTFIDFGGMWSAFRLATADRQDDATFSMKDLAEIAGCTPQNIQHWLNDGTIAATIQSSGGRSHSFSMTDAFAAMVVASLRRHNHPLNFCRRIANAITTLTPEAAEKAIEGGADTIEVEPAE